MRRLPNPDWTRRFGSTRNWRQRSGFTLIEVLVVVGIIGLLVAILVPSVAKSRQQARAVVCMSNLREWGKAIQMYANDHDDTLPFENRPKADEVDNDVEDPYYPYVWKDKGWVCWFDSMDKYFGYVNKSEDFGETVKICPSVHRMAPEAEESYRMNSKLAETNETSPYYRPYRKLDTLKRRNQTVLLFDGKVGTVDQETGKAEVSFKGRWRANDCPSSSDVDCRHLKRANVLFTDWHLESLTKGVLGEKSIKNEPIVWSPADMEPWDVCGGE
jgi:prepilin-type N-terminal cleavage/methylation domain-containing protein/prepilin-type processing-associated H-X9-DG protein